MTKSLRITMVCLLLVSLGFSQMTGVRVTGLVTDQRGAAVKDALVNLINVTTSRKFMAKTNKEGGFNVVGIPPGDYTVQVMSSFGDTLYNAKHTISSNPTELKLTTK